ncbi:MAG: hypothetical protein M0R23_07455 [Bacteroidales bacterium]|nr:hypothetical protein [Bacteroidales bacterium]
MSNLKIILTIAVILTCNSIISAQNPQKEEKINIPEMAAKEADNLMGLFKLEEYQVFLVDSVLQANLPVMIEEMTKIKQSGASNQESFQYISDKWLDKTDEAFFKIFTKEQWNKYLKSSYGKEKKKRDKRLKKLLNSNENQY